MSKYDPVTGETDEGSDDSWGVWVLCFGLLIMGLCIGGG